jgi:hypothetical protein
MIREPAKAGVCGAWGGKRKGDVQRDLSAKEQS